MGRNDYYPFGMIMQGRSYAARSGYRYGFNGKEKDKDLHSLTAYDYGFRIYNPAIGKFLSVDPMSEKYPSFSPYNAFINSPIGVTDKAGDSIFIIAGNGELYYVYRAAINLPSAAGIRAIQQSSTQHVFITVQDFSTRAVGSGNGAGGVTYVDITNPLSGGNRYYNAVTQQVNVNAATPATDIALLNFNGLDLSRFTGQTVSLISMNSTFLNSKNIRSSDADNLRGIMELFMHELLAHIIGSVGGVAATEHTNYGSATSLYLGGNPGVPTPGSPAAALKTELDNLRPERPKERKADINRLNRYFNWNRVNVDMMINPDVYRRRYLEWVEENLPTEVYEQIKLENDY